VNLLVLLYNIKYSFRARMWEVLCSTAFSSPPTYSWVLDTFEPMSSLRCPPPAANYLPRADPAGCFNTSSYHRRQTEDQGICRIHSVLEDEDMALNIFIPAAKLLQGDYGILGFIGRRNVTSLLCEMMSLYLRDSNVLRRYMW
jgi:hypothetical protein